MKSKQVLSVVQMKHLEELGLDTSDASMHWQFLPTADSIINGTDETEKEPTLFVSQPNMKHEYPAYTLHDILSKLPRYINDFGATYKMCVEPLFSGPWAISYQIGISESFIFKVAGNLLDAAYDMLCWCVENGYFKEGEQ